MVGVIDSVQSPGMDRIVDTYAGLHAGRETAELHRPIRCDVSLRGTD
jgi:hypothetical protein